MAKFAMLSLKFSVAGSSNSGS